MTLSESSENQPTFDGNTDKLKSSIRWWGQIPFIAYYEYEGKSVK